MGQRTAKPVFLGSAPPFPISRAVRAGDFAITCAMGDRTFEPEEPLYDERGRVVSTGARLQEVTFAEEVHGTFKALRESLALADCTPVRSVFGTDFMFDSRLEIKVMAYQPL